MKQFTSAITQSLKKKVSVFTTLFLLFSVLYSTAQTGIQWCGSDIMRQKNFSENPRTKQKNDSIEHVIFLAAQQKVQQKKLEGGPLPSPMQIYTIPVVVHIIHNNGPENIPDAQVITGIQHLNDAFSNVGYYDPSTGVDVEIEFCLAKQDENGNYTTGINRVVSPLTNVTMETQDLSLKNLIRWNPTKYLNFWIVKEITSLSYGSAVLGYASFPSSHGQMDDGIVVEPYYLGYLPNDAKVTVHEVGHYLGLYHTFEGGCGNNNCQTDGDKVCDTPPDASIAPVSCNANVNSCTTDAIDLSINNPFRPIANGGVGGQNDMIINYMDYGDYNCFSAFTPGQKNRMIPSLSGIRNSLLQSIACNSACTGPLTALFNASAVNVIAGSSVSFSNSSLGATGYTWQLNGTTFSTSTNSSYIFNTQGNYTVKLIAANAIGCTEEYSITITVTCPVTASFTVSSTNVSPGDNVTFTNTSTGATSYQWQIDGVAQGSTTNFSNTFLSAGNFMVSLTASNGICSTTFNSNVNIGCMGKEANIWYFGEYAGLDFNSGSPVALTNGALDTEEGCATISTNAGALLFYTDGLTVWNNTHVPMPNGTGLLGALAGSSTQSAIIVPKPGSTNIYYLFTVDEQGGPGGLRYSEVDMALDGGLGDITATKNILLSTPVTEKLTAVRKANNVDCWVLAHDLTTNAFLTYSVTSSGVNTTPIISNAGSVDTSGYGIGFLKASTNGSKLVSTSSYTNWIDVLNFSKATGLVTTDFTFSPVLSQNVYSAYGAEFSPDGTRLYLSGFSWLDSIYQYNMTLGTSSAIIASAIAIGSTPYYNVWFPDHGALQIAPDGKIYLVKRSSATLACINYPNTLGVGCGFVDTAVNLLGRTGNLGLPNFMPSFFYNGAPVIIGPDSICAQNVTYLLNTQGFNSVSWSLDGNGVITSSSDSACTIAFNGSGIDTIIVEATGNCGVKSDTMFVTTLQTPNPALGNDTLICQGSSITLNAGAGYTSYLWQDGSTNQTHTVNTSGQYKVTVTNSNGCSTSDSITVNIAAPVASLNLGMDIISCNGGVIVIDAGNGFSTYQWQDGATNQKYTVYQPGKYWVTVSSCGNTSSDTITVTWESSIPFTITQEGDLCGGKSVALKADPSNLASYIWDNGTNEYTRDVQSAGLYWLTVTDANGCYDQDSVDVLVSDCNCVMAVPTAFSPNNDGHNDLFVLHGFENCVSTFSILIFDRWGEKVFETENVTKAWDGTYKGKLMNTAVFVYYINATLNSGEKINKKGNISLIR